jgi:hypothetical protein
LSDTSHRTQIIVATLGLVGALATGVFSNWDKIFPAAGESSGPGLDGAGLPRSAAETGDGAREPSPSAQHGVLLHETFDDDSRGWPDTRGGDSHDAYYDNGTYAVRTKNEFTSLEVISPGFPRPQRFDLELTATWKDGVDNSRYGLVLGVDRSTYYSFAVSGNGQATIAQHIDNQPGPQVMPWTLDSARRGNGMASNLLKVEVRGDDLTYFVNGIRLAEVRNSLIKDRWSVGVMVQDRQRVTFDDLVIRASAP